MMFNLEKLTVWQKAIEYADSVYDITQSFPDCERFELSNQLRRAAVSISSNISGGSSRSTGSDYGRFLEISYGSLMETVSQLFIAQRRAYVDEQAFDQLYAAAVELARMFTGLRKSVRVAKP